MKKRIKAILRSDPILSQVTPECCYCGLNLTGSIFLTREHLLPRYKGGADSKRNLKGCCSGCNHMRGKMNLRDFQAHVQHLSFNNPNDTRLKKMVDNIRWHAGYVEACELALKDK